MRCGQKPKALGHFDLKAGEHRCIPVARRLSMLLEDLIVADEILLVVPPRRPHANPFRSAEVCVTADAKARWHPISTLIALRLRLLRDDETEAP